MGLFAVSPGYSPESLADGALRGRGDARLSLWSDLNMTHLTRFFLPPVTYMMVVSAGRTLTKISAIVRSMSTRRLELKFAITRSERSGTTACASAMSASQRPV